MHRIFALLSLPLLGLLPLLAGAAELSNLKALAAKNVAITALVVDISRGRVIAQLNPDRHLIPASVTKLLIDAASLERFGPHHRFETALLSNGKLEDGELQGDLIFRGGGDPALTTDGLWDLVTRLRQNGIEEIQGDLIVDASLFGKVPCFAEDRCKALKASSNGYDSPLSSAGINHGTVEIRVRPGSRNGEAARLALMPPSLNIPMSGDIKTTTRKKRPLYGVRRTTKDGNDQLHAYGQVPYGGGPYHIYRGVSEPARHSGEVLAALLEEAGIELEGKLRVSYTPVEGKLGELADLHSDELGQILRSMMIYSNNYMADLLTLHQASTRDPRPVTLPDAGKRLEDFVRKVHRESPAWLKVPDNATGLTLHSGSGLTVGNRIAARDLVATLVHMNNRHDLFPGFLGTLSVPRHAPSRMLRRAGNRDWMTKIAVKTGYLSEPVTVLSLSGYIRLKDGGWGAFAAITNGTQKRRSVSARLSMQAIRQDLESIMANY